MDIAKTIQAIEILFGILKDQLGHMAEPAPPSILPEFYEGLKKKMVEENKPKRKYKKRKKLSQNESELSENEPEPKPAKKKWGWSEERKKKFAETVRQRKQENGRSIDSEMHCNSCGHDFNWDGLILDAYCPACESGAVAEKKDVMI